MSCYIMVCESEIIIIIINSFIKVLINSKVAMTGYTNKYRKQKITKTQLN
jgi:hypothetical protein